MSSRVHAIIVTSAGDTTRSVPHLERTLSAVGSSSVVPDAVTVVVPESNAELLAVVANSSLPGLNVQAVRGNYSFVEAVQSVSVTDSAELIWLLSQDSAPKRLALGHLLRVLETAPAVAIAAPKLLRWRHEHQIVSQGVTMTRHSYRSVDLIRGDFDQGQHNDREEVMGADPRGLLIRRAAWQSIGGLDRAFSGVDLGLDLGYRAWLNGWRVRAVPSAEVLTAGDMVAGSADPWNPIHSRRQYLQQRRARYHRMLSYSPAYLVPLLWLAIIPMSLWYTLVGLLSKRPWTISANWAAALLSLVSLRAVRQSRHRLSKIRKLSPGHFVALFADYQQLSEAMGSNYAAISGPVTRRSISFFSGGGSWITLALITLSVVLFYPLLRWQSLSGGAAFPMGDSPLALWQHAFFGLSGAGVAPPVLQDPFNLVMAALGTLTFWAPNTAIIYLWLLAIPLAGFGAWVAATRLSDKASVRALFAVLWALMPPLLTALNEGRVAAVLVHLLLPWLFYTAAVAKRSWGASAAASIIAFAIVACAPSLLPALLLATIVALIYLSINGHGRGGLRLMWVPIPAIVFFLPLFISQLLAGNALAILADPGPVTSWGGLADAPLERLWALFGANAPAAFSFYGVPLNQFTLALLLVVFVPVLVFAVIALVARRYQLAVGAWLLLLLGAGGVLLMPQLKLSHLGSESVGIWYGPHASLFILGLLLAAVIGYDYWWRQRSLQHRTRRGNWRNLSAHIVAALSVVLIAAFSFPSMSSVLRGEADVYAGNGSTLPAYVTASGASNPKLGTLVVDPIAQNQIATTVIWGSTETMVSVPSKISTEQQLNPQEIKQAELAVELSRSAQPGAVTELARTGVAFVLLRDGGLGADGHTRELLLNTASSLDANPALDSVGVTERGQLWRVSVPLSEREALGGSELAINRVMWVVYGIFALAVLLLALPTVDSVRRAQRMPRQIGTLKRRR